MKDCWYKVRTSESRFNWEPAVFHDWGADGDRDGVYPVAILEDYKTGDIFLREATAIRFQEPKDDYSSLEKRYSIGFGRSTRL